MTNIPREEVERTGGTAVEMVELKEGPLEQFTHEMEPFLRKQGMLVRLNRGAVELLSDFVYVKKGNLSHQSLLGFCFDSLPSKTLFLERKIGKETFSLKGFVNYAAFVGDKGGYIQAELSLQMEL
ncbi:PREDICTED: mRNA turnover protein 4 homolog [Tarenaya hassleriana]|uniref:mRNA turnover protein 4 homolog n=1 Tax=Tarenaya hassleriana TaxID=28532 RepID=UPI00053C09A6|nr:PREDICTED: mRNA turnover protein 4 homolog [Tarenaya hassleriana]